MRTEEKKNGRGKTHPFVTDVKEIARRARTHIEDAAVTEVRRAHRETVVRLLNEALASAIVCVLRYRRHYFMATGIHGHALAQEFLQHAHDEQGHADLIAARITQLGGEPDVSPAGLLTRSHFEYIEGKDLLHMIREDLVAERIDIDSYGQMIWYFGNDDPTSRRLIEKILAQRRRTRRISRRSSRRWGATSGPPSLRWTRAANRSSTSTVLVERRAPSASHERAARDHRADLPPVSDGWTKVQTTAVSPGP